MSSTNFDHVIPLTRYTRASHLENELVADDSKIKMTDVIPVDFPC